MGDDDFDAMMATESTPVNMIRQIPLLLTFGIASFAGKIWVQLHTTTFLGGILTKLWRSRRLLADATAVQLTRNPDALGRAVVRLADLNVEPSGRGGDRLPVRGMDSAGRNRSCGAEQYRC